MTRSPSTGAWTLALAVAACSGPAKPAAPNAPEERPAQAAIDETPPTLRLPAVARPIRYDLNLSIVPDRAEYHGSVGIDLEIVQPTQTLWLNATDIAVSEARLTVTDGEAGASYGLRTLDGGEDFVGFALPQPVAPGRARLDVAFRGTLDSERSRGIYREKEGDAWYVYTFFEPLDGRRGFPCFDEPNYKVPWKLTFTVPEGHVARANAPIASERVGAGGMKTVAFAESKPMPSYLVAFVVGPFDVVDGPPAGRKPVRVQFLVPEGRGPETRYAAGVTPRIVSLLEDYFDMPYPYEKLDVAVVPRFWGTMEHPGIVAMGQPLTLIKPDQDTIWRRIGYVNIGIHELAHYWFGDYVTMAWWDDTWLNEALASWLDIKITDAFDRSWEYAVDSLSIRESAMSTDSLPTAKKIREPVATKHDIANAFDGAITYAKGALVLAMFEAWKGEEPFRVALRAYLDEFAWGNADTDGFLRVMSRELGADFGPAFRTFLDQPGFPLVSVDVACGGGAPKLRLSQRHFTPAGHEPTDRLWQVPVCVRYGGAAGAKVSARRTCVLLRDRAAEFPLDGPQCPGWVMANAGGAGYYRTVYSDALTGSLLAAQKSALTIAERVVALSDLVALVQTGAVSAADMLALVPGLVKEDNRHLATAALRIVGFADRLASDAMRPNFARFVRSLYAAKARELGWTPAPGEPQSATRMRPRVLSMVAVDGGDPDLRREALRLARRYLDDRAAVHPTLVGTVLRVGARLGDAALFDAYLAQARAQSEHRERRRFLFPLGSFSDPALVERALGLLLSDEFDIRDTMSLLYVTARHDDHPEVAYRFVRDNFAKLVARMRSDEAAALRLVVASLCDNAAIEAAEADFTDKFKTFDGGPRELANALDRARRCARLKTAEQPAIDAFLRSW